MRVLLFEDEPKNDRGWGELTLFGAYDSGVRLGRTTSAARPLDDVFREAGDCSNLVRSL
jgi:hypothetical protein